jgi:hypothetical protein
MQKNSSWRMDVAFPNVKIKKQRRDIIHIDCDITNVLQLVYQATNTDGLLILDPSTAPNGNLKRFSSRISLSALQHLLKRSKE